MTTKVRRKPGRIDRIGLKYGKKLCVINHIKTFGKIKEAEESKFLAVSGGKDMIGYGKERGFCGEKGAETVLG